MRTIFIVADTREGTRTVAMASTKFEKGSRDYERFIKYRLPIRSITKIRRLHERVVSAYHK